MGTGFWHGAVYQVHRMRQEERELQTKVGPLPLEAVLEVGYARVAEIRKFVGQASVQHPQLGVKRTDNASCEAPCSRGSHSSLEADGTTLREDLSEPPKLVPFAMLGCEVVYKVAVELLTDGGRRVHGSHVQDGRARGRTRRRPAARAGAHSEHVRRQCDGDERRSAV